jgi:hypothetical protein
VYYMWVPSISEFYGATSGKDEVRALLLAYSTKGGNGCIGKTAPLQFSSPAGLRLGAETRKGGGRRSLRVLLAFAALERPSGPQTDGGAVEGVFDAQSANVAQGAGVLDDLRRRHCCEITPFVGDTGARENSRDPSGEEDWGVRERRDPPSTQPA